ncbi:MAG TPA: hypothetical protein DEO86_22905 [Colwellia sp.]|nr:hypothetical protein [Colwellia sp.]|tara:strand:- start:1864 stop:4623 length:2760 start_codon:yes stop_codon:yes gene_type:complete
MNNLNNKENHLEFIASCNHKLQVLSPKDTPNFNEVEWDFKFNGRIAKVNFRCFLHEYTNFTQNISLVFDGEKIDISIIEFAKVLWLSLMEGKTVQSNINRRLNCIAILFSYLTSENVNCFSESDLEGLYNQILTMEPTDSGLSSRFSVPAYKTYFALFDVKSLLHTINSYGLNQLLLPRVALKKHIQYQNSACLNIMGITLSDYKKGGSFNFIGLDIGRHYIDFCSEVFEKHYVYATACHITFNNILNVVRKNLDYRNDNLIKRICADALMGISVDEIILTKGVYIDKKKMKEIHKVSVKLFCNKYNEIVLQSNAFKIENINAIIKKLGLPSTRFDNQEFVRSMLFCRYYGENGKTRKQMLLEFKSSLGDIELDCGIEEFDSITDNIIFTPPLNILSTLLLCKRHFQKCINLRPYGIADSSAGMTKLKFAIANVESAGVILFVALTGWRSSEFGFPLSSIQISINYDVLDSIYSPYRFHVFWKVPKTSGETPLEREITLSGYLIASQLSILNQSVITAPCLYNYSKEKDDINDSKPYIGNRIANLWQGFCNHYCLFTDLDEQESLLKKENLSNIEQSKLEKLNKSYDRRSSKTQRLLEIRSKLLMDLPRYILTKTRGDMSFKKVLQYYQKGILPTNELQLLEQYLSDETKHTLKVELCSLDALTVRVIVAEFLEGVVYPTPHAMRHMWAEAVLRRYRGDVGKFIRANFKHITERFFMAYLRDKETSMLYEVAQRNVINSIVREHLFAIKDNYRIYSGGFDSYLSKVVHVTKIVSHEEYIKTAKVISEDRVVAIKANPWATCLLRVGTSQNTKCAEDGIPQRRNASPKFCLACVNGNVSEGNFNGIVVYTRSEVEACRNPDLPAFVKVSCIEVLKPALIQVKKLRKNSGNMKYDNFIAHLEESIEMALKTVQEEKNNGER